MQPSDKLASPSSSGYAHVGLPQEEGVPKALTRPGIPGQTWELVSPIFASIIRSGEMKICEGKQHHLHQNQGEQQVLPLKVQFGKGELAAVKMPPRRLR